MKQKLVYILKHNEVVLAVYKVVMSFIFRVLGLFVRTDRNLVLFVSFMGSKFNDSPKVLYEYMMSHEEYQGYKMVWAFEKPDEHPELNTVKIDTLPYFITALKAEYWITNTNIERGLTFKKKKTKYLNTWHGIALKLIGNDCPGRTDYNFKTIDYLTVCGDHDEKVFKSAFRANEKSYLRCGLPRNEILWNVKDEDKKRMKEKLGLCADQKVILYAPTWRDTTNGGKSYDIKPPIHFDLWEKTLGNDYVILFRAHHLTTKILGVKYNDFVRNYSDYSNVNDLLIASDILITDYSAIAFDYSILERPIFCYTYDFDTYLAERGTYFDMDEMYPNRTCRNESDLLERIQNIDYKKECENTKRFKDSFNFYGKDATRICVETLFKEKKSDGTKI